MSHLELVSLLSILMCLKGQRIPVDATQLLLRGSQLRNTKFIYGLVVYTGEIYLEIFIL